MLWVRVKHSGKLVDVELPHDQCTIRDLKVRLAASLRVPVEKQRLLVASHPGKLPADDAILSVALPRACTTAPLTAQAPATVMVIGVPEIHIHPDDDNNGSAAASAAQSDRPSAPASESSHLVSVTVDATEGMYNCSYVVGNVAQDAFYCRTCSNGGFAEAQHFMCYACAEVCHKGHDVENWGLHHFLRCDCATVRCCTPAALVALEVAMAQPATVVQPSASGNANEDEDEADIVDSPRRCKFVVDERTAKPPLAPLAANARNTYPEDPKTWCYCKGADALPEEIEEGINCMMCHSCFYAPHIRRLHTDVFLLVSCYAETSGCDTLGYTCQTCNDGKVYCPPCAVHCHEGHTLLLEDPARFDWRQGATEAERGMVCACRAACRIAHTVPESHLIELSKRLAASALPLVPPSMATQLIEDDELSAFVCARCMQRHPWLWDPAAAVAAASGRNEGGPCPTDMCALRHCWRGKLPAPISDIELRPPLACRSGVAPAAPRRDVFPYHGMLVPEDMQKFVCQCNLCQAAYAALFPRNTSPTENALQLFSSYGNQCQQCGSDVERSCGYFCVTCELGSSTTGNAAVASTQNSFFVCETCANDPAVRLAHQQERSPGGIVHEFLQDSVENLWRVLGASLVHTVDRDTREWMLEHWNDGASRDAVMEYMRESFGARRLNEPLVTSSAGDGPVEGNTGAAVVNTDAEDGSAAGGASGTRRKRDRSDDEGMDG